MQNTTIISIDAAIARFRDHLESARHAPKTVKNYVDDVLAWRAWLKKTSIVARIDLVVRDDVTDYLLLMARQTAPVRGSRLDGDAQTGLAPATIKRRLAALRRFATFLKDAGLHSSCVTDGVKGPRGAAKEPAFLNQQEYKALLFEARRRERPRDYAILMTFLQTGIREGELCRLTLADADLDRRELRVRGRKGGVDTDIPLSSDAIDALRSWLANRPATESNRLFLSKTRRPLTERALRYLVRAYISRAGIRKRASVHTLRHTFGSHKANRGVDIAQLQYWMGHKRRETTLTYIHLIKKRAPELMEATAL